MCRLNMCLNAKKILETKRAKDQYYLPFSVDTLPLIQLTALWTCYSTASWAFQFRESFESSLHVNKRGGLFQIWNGVRFRTGVFSL